MRSKAEVQTLEKGYAVSKKELGEKLALQRALHGKEDPTTRTAFAVAHFGGILARWMIGEENEAINSVLKLGRGEQGEPDGKV